MKTHWAALLLLTPPSMWADCTQMNDLIDRIRPGANYTVRGNVYSGIDWQDQVQVKPTAGEIATAFTDCRAAAIARAAQKTQAKLDVRNTGLTQAQRFQALLILLDYDQ